MNSLFRKTGIFLKNQQFVNICVNSSLFGIQNSSSKVRTLFYLNLKPESDLKFTKFNNDR
jgi:hypothetical protein